MQRKYEREVINTQNYTCIRLSVNRENKQLIQGFCSKKNGNLAQYLHLKAWAEDTENYRAYYLVRDSNKIVLYFSLQCGLLIKCHKKLLGGITHKVSDEKVVYSINDDKIDVDRVIPGVELAHLCVNDSYRKRMQRWSVLVGVKEYPVGAYVFYEYIAPLIIEMAAISGLQYTYLFCADDGSNKLVQYYINVLHFAIMDDMACVRPEYDQNLTCMTIKISELRNDTMRFNDLKRVSTVLEYLKTNKTISIDQAKKKLNINDPRFLFAEMVKHGVASALSSTNNVPTRVEVTLLGLQIANKCLKLSQ